MHKAALLHRLGVVLAVIVLLTSAIGLLLLNGIQSPLKQLTAATEKFRQGDLSSRAHYEAGNEFGTLSRAFNSLAETVQVELENNAATIHFEEILRSQDETHALCQELLKSLLQYTGSQIGAVYLLNSTRKTEFEHFESIGLNSAARAAFPAASGEGEFGAALATRRIQRVAGHPGGHPLRFFQRDWRIHAARDGHRPHFLAGASCCGDHFSGQRAELFRGADPGRKRRTWGLMSARLNNSMSLHEIRAIGGEAGAPESRA